MPTANQQKRKIDSIMVCAGLTCGALAGQGIMRTIKERYPEGAIDLRFVGCTGNCSYANNLVLNDEYLVSNVTPKNLDEKLRGFEAGADDPGGKGYTEEELDKAIENFF